MDTQKNAVIPFRRTIIKNGRKVDLRVVPVSKESLEKLGDAQFRTIFSHIGINPRHIERQHIVELADLKRSLAMMTPDERDAEIRKGPIDFVKDKSGYKLYEVRCSTCGDVVAQVWATDDTLRDWCDLHYMSWHDKNTWYGAMAVNISPVDGHLGFECACGEDTRDYRANRSMPPVTKRLMIEYTMNHRDFAKPTSKFIAMAKGKQS